MDDLSSLNNELNSLTRDFTRYQELQQIRQNLVNDPAQTRVNSRMSELTQFQGRYIRPDSGPNPAMDMGTAPQTQNTRVDMRQAGYNQALQQQKPQMQHHYVTAPRTIQTTPPDEYVDPRQDMNSRLDRFRFESVNPTASLVPVNMDHIYSGNLFTEGLPVPSDLRDQFTLSSPSLQPGSRLLHQEKSKTGYRNDVNDRLSKLSPLGRALYYPVSGEGQQIPGSGPGMHAQSSMNTQTQMPHISSRRGAHTDDINSRLSSHPALGSAMPMDDNLLNYGRTALIQDAPNMTPNLDPNKQVKKVVYQDMYPVMSN